MPALRKIHSRYSLGRTSLPSAVNCGAGACGVVWLLSPIAATQMRARATAHFFMRRGRRRFPGGFRFSGFPCRESYRPCPAAAGASSIKRPFPEDRLSICIELRLTDILPLLKPFSPAIFGGKDFDG